MRLLRKISQLQENVAPPTLTNNEDGFTFFELLVVAGIIAIFAGAALVKRPDVSGAFDRMNARSFVLQDLKRAQAETLTTGCRGIMQINGDGSGYFFGCDYLNYDTTVPPNGDEVSFSRQLPPSVTISANADRIIFNSRGHTVDVNDVMTTVTVTFTKHTGGSSEDFATGTLLGVGMFTFN